MMTETEFLQLAEGITVSVRDKHEYADVWLNRTLGLIVLFAVVVILVGFVRRMTR